MDNIDSKIEIVELPLPACGQIVRLKSGGPLMTVRSVGEETGGDTMIYCNWFDRQGNPRGDWFFQPMLMLGTDEMMPGEPIRM